MNKEKTKKEDEQKDLTEYYITPYWEKELERYEDVEKKLKNGVNVVKTKDVSKENDDKDEKKKCKSKRRLTWSFDSPVIDECPIVNEEIRVVINKLTKNKIKAMMETMESDEWLGLLKGRELKGDNKGWIVSDLYIPEQEVTGASAVKEERGEPSDVIGIIHSHHKMGTFWSGTDSKHANSNFDLSIVVDSDMNAKGICKARTQCGKLMHIEPEIVMINDYDKMMSWAKEMKEKKIRKYVYKPKQTYSGLNNYKYGSYYAGKRSKKISSDKKKEKIEVNDISDSDAKLYQLEDGSMSEETLTEIVKRCKDIPMVALGDMLSFEDWILIYGSTAAQEKWPELSDDVKLQYLKDYILDIREWFEDDKYDIGFLNGVYDEGDKNEN